MGGGEGQHLHQPWYVKGGQILGPGWTVSWSTGAEDQLAREKTSGGGLWPRQEEEEGQGGNENLNFDVNNNTSNLSYQSPVSACLISRCSLP